MSEHLVQIGACGWQHRDWIGEFYPDDLPEEWQLGYYGNEFQVVLVPASYWQAGPESFEQWLEESDESLRMVCELPKQGSTADSISQAIQGIEMVSQRVSAVMVPIESDLTDRQKDIYKELAKSYPLCFDLAADIGQDKRKSLLHNLAESFEGFDYGVCWHADQRDKQVLKLGSISITRIDREFEPKELRSILESIMTQGGAERQMILLVDGQPPSQQLLTNAGIILDLL